MILFRTAMTLRGQTVHWIAAQFMYAPGFHRQTFKHVPKCQWIPLTKVPWIPRNCKWIPQNVSGIRNCNLKWIPQNVSGIRKCKWNPRNL